MALSKTRPTFCWALVTGAVISIAVCAFFLHLDLNVDPAVSRLQTDRFPLPRSWTIFASLLIGMALGTQLALLWANWHRMRSVLKPNIGRLIGFAILIVLAPVSQIWGIPVANIFWLFWLINSILTGEMFSWHNIEYNQLAPTILTICYLPLFYIFSCLSISGIQRKPLRIAIFGQVWLAAYGTVLLIFGFYSGNM